MEIRKETTPGGVDFFFLGGNNRALVGFYERYSIRHKRQNPTGCSSTEQLCLFFVIFKIKNNKINRNLFGN